MNFKLKVPFKCLVHDAISTLANCRGWLHAHILGLIAYRVTATYNI